MKLTIATPLAIVIDIDDVVHLRAEDRTGAFGILNAHADFLTALSVSVVSWRDADDHMHHVAVRGGMLRVHDGRTISIATREAIAGDDLDRLEHDVLARFRQAEAEEQAARTDAQRLYLAAVRRILRYVRPDRVAAPAGPLPGGAPAGREP